MAEVLSVSETARELKVSSQTVRDWADSGKLVAMRTAGGQRIFRAAEVERLQSDLRKSREVSG
jgi:excisionase family DNA binding protein